MDKLNKTTQADQTGRLKNYLDTCDKINLKNFNSIKQGDNKMSKLLFLNAKSVSLSSKGDKITINDKTFKLSDEIIKASKSGNYDNFRVLVLQFIQGLYIKFNVDSIKRKVYVRRALLSMYNKSLVYRVDYVIKPLKAKTVKTTKAKITKPKKAKTTKTVKAKTLQVA